MLMRLNPFQENLSAPLIFESILRVIALNDVHLAAKKSQMCELYITPRVEGFGILEFQSFEQIIEVGYRSAREAIEDWSRGTPANGLPSKRKEPISITLNQTLAEMDGVLNQMAQVAY